MIIEDFYANRKPRTYDKIAPTIRAEREGLKVIEDAKTTRGADVVSTIRASYYKTGERNIRENIVSGKGYEGVIEETRCLAVRYRKYLHRQRGEEENPPHVELGEEGLLNSLTTVQKDNLVMEKKINKVGQISNEGSQCGTVVSDEGLSPTLSAGTHGYANAHAYTEHRIRKLTEKECFRLMGFKDSDFEKARAVNSATQIYKQAGNSIIRQVLIAIFLQLNIQGIKNWNDRTKEEREEFYK